MPSKAITVLSERWSRLCCCEAAGTLGAWPSMRNFSRTCSRSGMRAGGLRLAEELAVMRELPARRMESAKRERVKVDSGSLIHVERNSYSVNSRLIGERVEARLYLDHVEVWYGQRKVEDLPRLRGRSKHRVDYRHIIEWLVRKPGAFENYRYQEDLFPTSRFRMAYDALQETAPSRYKQGVLEDFETGGRGRRGPGG